MQAPVDAGSACSTVASLLNSTLAFWAEHGPDWEQGGFFTTLDRWGAPILGYSTSDKYLLTSARQARGCTHRPWQALCPWFSCIGAPSALYVATSAASSVRNAAHATHAPSQIIAWATLALQHPEDERGWEMAQRAFAFFNASALYDPADGLFRYQAGAGRGPHPQLGCDGRRLWPCRQWAQVTALHNCTTQRLPFGVQHLLGISCLCGRLSRACCHESFVSAPCLTSILPVAHPWPSLPHFYCPTNPTYPLLQVSRDGATPYVDHKFLYGQAFAIMGLARWAGHGPHPLPSCPRRSAWLRQHPGCQPATRGGRPGPCKPSARAPGCPQITGQPNSPATRPCAAPPLQVWPAGG